MQKDLRIYAKGSAFSNGIYDLRALETLISSHRKILDRLVSVQLGKRQVTKELRSRINYETQINPGSIELLVNFLLEHKELIAVLPALVADGGQSLSEAIFTLLRDAIDLRKKAAEFVSKGIKVNISITNNINFGSNNSNVSLTNTQGTIAINDPKILWAAQVTRAPVNELLSYVDGHSIDYIDLSTSTNDLRLTPDDRKIIGREKEELPTTLTIIGRLDVVRFTSHRGIIVSDNERFEVNWGEQIRSKMQKIADIEGIHFKVRPVIDHKSLNNSIVGFHVLDCEDPQGKFFKPDK